ncbi:MAG: PAS domain S-box protein, partial [Pseudomonadota bacterium]
KFSTLILMVILITGIAAITISALLSKNIIETEVYNHLENVAISRARHIETLLEMHKEIVKILATERTFIDVVTNQNSVASANQRIKALIQSEKIFSRIRVLDKKGNVVVSSHLHLGIDKHGNAEIFTHGKEGVYIRDIHISMMTNTLVFSISAPIVVNGEFAGILIINIEAQEDLYEITTDRTGLGKTGEIYLINKEGYMITPSRFVDDTVFFKVKLDSKKVKEWFSDGKEIEHYENYRGQMVIGAHRTIKGMDWCLLAERNAKEPFVPVDVLVTMLFWFIIFLLGIGIIVALVLTETVTRPILRLHKKVHEIKAGNWDYQVNIDSKDEIGEFSRAFDSMAARLRESEEELKAHGDALEATVAERTIELAQRHQALLESQARLDNILDNLDIGIALISPKMQILQLNRKMREWFPNLNAEGQEHLLCADKPLKALCNDCPSRKTLQDGKLHEAVIDKSVGNQILNYRVVSTPLLDAKGNVVAAIEMVEDITKRRQVEKRIQKSEERFRKVFEEAPLGMVITTVESDIFTVNQTFCHMLGYTQQELMEMRVADITYPEDMPKSREQIAKMLTHERPSFQMDKRYVKKNGQLIWGNVTASCFYDEDNTPSYCLAMIEDITQRKQAEEELRKLSLAIEQSPSILVITDIHGNIEYVNPKFTQITGYTASQVIGKNPRILKSNKQSTEFYKALWENILSGKEWRGEIQNQKKDGTLYWESVSISSMKDAENNITHFIKVAEDITERKRWEESLKQAKKAAEAANRAKSEFMANMSHEIRTPLNAVIGFSDLLSSMITDKKHKSYLSSIQTAGKTLLTLINDILDLSKIEAGRLEIQSEPINPTLILTELEHIFAVKIAEKKLEFIVEIDKELPPALVLDETRLRQVLLNLIGNAIKFTEQGYIKLSLYKRSQENDSSKVDLIIVVADTGIGIPEVQHETIFEAFQQQDGQSTRKYGGTGLGLAISKRLVEMMNGQISVRSQEKQGSVFEIILRDVEVHTLALPARDDSIDFKNIAFEPARVLVVDDIESNRVLLREWLEQFNLEVIEAEDGQSGLLFAEEYQPALILMDIKMPIMDGYEATLKLKKNPSTQQIPVIALTASALLSEQSEIKAYGFDGYLFKPVSISELLSELSRYLKHKVVEPFTETADDDSLPNLSDIPVEKLEQCQSDWEEIHDGLDLEEIKQFAHKINEIGQEYHISQFCSYGEQLSEFVQTFDFEEIEKQLNEFPGMIGARYALHS